MSTIASTTDIIFGMRARRPLYRGKKAKNSGRDTQPCKFYKFNSKKISYSSRTTLHVEKADKRRTNRSSDIWRKRVPVSEVKVLERKVIELELVLDRKRLNLKFYVKPYELA